MLQRLLHTLTFYILKKSLFERIVLFCLFVSCLLAILSSVKYEEWTTKTRKQIDITAIQGDIVSLFDEYKIQSKCVKIICTNKELQRRGLQTTLPYTTKHYTIFFTCDSMLCYEFIRSLEELPTLFIHEVVSSNATIIQNPLDNTLHNDNDIANMRWKQDIRVVFSIGTYQI